MSFSTRSDLKMASDSGYSTTSRTRISCSTKSE